MSKYFSYKNIMVSFSVDDTTNNPYINMEYKGITRRIYTTLVEITDYFPMITKTMDKNIESMLMESRRKKINKIKCLI